MYDPKVSSAQDKKRKADEEYLKSIGVEINNSEIRRGSNADE